MYISRLWRDPDFNRGSSHKGLTTANENVTILTKS